MISFCLPGSACFCLSGSAWFCLSGSAGFVLGVLRFVCLGVLVFVVVGVLGSACLSGPVFDLRLSMDACFWLSGSAWFCFSESR